LCGAERPVLVARLRLQAVLREHWHVVVGCSKTPWASRSAARAGSVTATEPVN